MELIQKLQFKEPENAFITGIPSELEEPLALLKQISLAETELANLDFALVFVQKQEQLNEWIDKVAPQLRGDALLWFAYPKKSSKRYSSEINRDSGWSRIGDHKMEPVRQIALNEDWSALRFRKLDFIKKLTRRDSMRLTKK